MRSASNEYFVGTTSPKRQSPRFHRPSCEWVPARASLRFYILVGKWKEFHSHQEAISKGYKACGTCNP